MTLSKWVDEKPIQITQVEILRQATFGLEWLHSQSIIHRDLKPENILLRSDLKRVKISDFGLSRHLIGGSTSVKTTAGGTDGWIAPEILAQMEVGLSEANFSFASDVFALGCVYYYVLTDGKHAFGDKIRRQSNIIDGNDTFDMNDVLFCCSQNLIFIKLMVSTDRHVRPSCSSILRYFPLFWSYKNLRKFMLFHHTSGSLQTMIKVLIESPCILEHNIELAALKELGLQTETSVGCMIVAKQCEWASEHYLCSNVTKTDRSTLTQQRRVSNATSADLNHTTQNSRRVLTPNNSLEFGNGDGVIQLDTQETTENTPKINDNPEINGNSTQEEDEAYAPLKMPLTPLICLTRQEDEAYEDEVSSDLGPKNKTEIQIGAIQRKPNLETSSTQFENLETGDVTHNNAVSNFIEIESEIPPTNAHSISVAPAHLDEMPNGYQNTAADDITDNFKQLEGGRVTRVKRLFEFVEKADFNKFCGEINTAKVELQLTELWDPDKFTLLHVAVASHRYEVVKYLIDQVGFLEVLFEDKFNDLIHICIQNIGIVEIDRFQNICNIIELLVSKRQDLIQIKEPFKKQTPLHVVATEDFLNGKRLEFIQKLIQNNADVNGIDYLLQTPLHLIVRESQQLMDIVELLIKNQANPDATDKNKETFLHVAAQNTTPDIFHALVDYLVSIKQTGSINGIDTHGCTAVHYAVQHFELMEQTLEILDQQGFNFNACDGNGNSLILHAIKGGRSRSFIEMLIDFGADVKLLNNAEDTALHWAALYGNISALELLLSLGENLVDVNAKNLDGNTPLHTVLKITEKHVNEVVIKLLDHNANVHLVNGNGDLPITLAKKRIVEKGQRMCIVELLKP
ncbi:unnamed protein product [Orchesella dallaii]|uniref:Protein kinase domain-containing protein n=1 Tax=Orchesella dallaii TaxID=48710 RepID=A0ABP1RQR9_9HEXA